MLPRRDHERISDAAIHFYADWGGWWRVGGPAEVDQVRALKFGSDRTITDPDAGVTRRAEIGSINRNLLTWFERGLLGSRVIDDSSHVDHGWLQTRERFFSQAIRAGRHCD